MSDTTWVNITFKKLDFDQINKIILKDTYWGNEPWYDELDESDTQITAHLWEANYGGSRITDALIENKISFDACYGAGGSYGPGAIACFEGEEVEVSTDQESNPIAIVNRDGVSQKDLHHIQKYYKIVDKVNKYIAGRMMVSK